MNWGQIKQLAVGGIHRKDIDYDQLQPLAVDDINLTLTVRENEASQSVVLAPAGIQTLVSGPLPADFMRPRAVFAGIREVGATDMQGLLASPNQAARFAISGTQIYTGAASPLTLIYSLRLAPAAGDSDTNPVMAAMSGVYVYALLKHAAHRIQDFDARDQHQMEFDRQVGELNAAYALTIFTPGARRVRSMRRLGASDGN